MIGQQDKLLKSVKHSDCDKQSCPRKMAVVTGLRPQ